MMPRPILLFALLATCLFTASGACNAAATAWVEGRHYSLVRPAQRTSVPPGMVEVMEVFSYGCPACNSFEPVMQRLKAGLPANARMVHLPASWNAVENWPTFQRAWFAAQALGVADRAHQAMYDAIWKTGELAVMDPATQRPKKVLPSIDDIARFYQRVTGVKQAEFTAAAASFGVEVKMKQADSQIIAMRIPGTPSIVIQGKYLLETDQVSDFAELLELTRFLIAKESPTAPAKP